MARYYPTDKGEYASVTTILDVLDKPALKGWAANCAVDYLADKLPEFCMVAPEQREIWLDEARGAYNAVSRGAMDFGNLGHDLIEACMFGNYHQPIIDAHIKEGMTMDTVEEGLDLYYIWADWNVAHKVEMVDCEKVGFNHDIKIAGRYDLKSRIYPSLGCKCGCNGVVWRGELTYPPADGDIGIYDNKVSKGLYEPQVIIQTGAYTTFSGNEDVSDIGGILIDKVNKKIKFRNYTPHLIKAQDTIKMLAEIFYMWYAKKELRR